jgi:hypothetical protein
MRRDGCVQSQSGDQRRRTISLITLLFVIMISAARQPDSTQFFTAAVQSCATALSQQRRSEDAPKPALEFQSLPAPSDTPKPPNASNRKGIRPGPSAVSTVTPEGKPERSGAIAASQRATTENRR